MCCCAFLGQPLYGKALARQALILLYQEQFHRRLSQGMTMGFQVFNEEPGEISLSVLARSFEFDPHRSRIEAVNERYLQLNFTRRYIGPSGMSDWTRARTSRRMIDPSSSEVAMAESVLEEILEAIRTGSMYTILEDGFTGNADHENFKDETCHSPHDVDVVTVLKNWFERDKKAMSKPWAWHIVAQLSEEKKAILCLPEGVYPPPVPSFPDESEALNEQQEDEGFQDTAEGDAELEPRSVTAIPLGYDHPWAFSSFSSSDTSTGTETRIRRLSAAGYTSLESEVRWQARRRRTPKLRRRTGPS
jgi:hypothetical protein